MTLHYLFPKSQIEVNQLVSLLHSHGYTVDEGVQDQQGVGSFYMLVTWRKGVRCHKDTRNWEADRKNAITVNQLAAILE